MFVCVFVRSCLHRADYLHPSNDCITRASRCPGSYMHDFYSVRTIDTQDATPKSACGGLPAAARLGCACHFRCLRASGCIDGPSVVARPLQRAFLAGPVVRKTPSWPGSWTDFSPLLLHPRWNAWATLHLLGQPNAFLACCAGLVAPSSRPPRARRGCGGRTARHLTHGCCSATMCYRMKLLLHMLGCYCT
jgi:hypothetical protein